MANKRQNSNLPDKVDNRTVIQVRSGFTEFLQSNETRIRVS